MAKSVGEGKKGQIECIACGDFFWYIGTPHHRNHSPELPQDYYDYKDYVGERFGLGKDHELLNDDTVISPNKWLAVRDDYPDVEIEVKLK